MQKLHKAIITFGFAAFLVSGSVTAFAKSSPSKERTVNGSIVSIDRAARTLIVREFGSNQLTEVRVPQGRNVRTGQTGLSSASFELLIAGMSIRDVRVAY